MSGINLETSFVDLVTQTTFKCSNVGRALTPVVPPFRVMHLDHILIVMYVRKITSTVISAGDKPLLLLNCVTKYQSMNGLARLSMKSTWATIELPFHTNKASDANMIWNDTTKLRTTAPIP